VRLESTVRLWFWGWLIVAAAIALTSAVMRDRASAPFAAGAAVSALVEALGGSPGWEWVAFAGVSSVLFVAFNRRRQRARHARSAAGRHHASHAPKHG
jgi:membrane protein implicated in regulation of membrane protease activity